jgi:hypothetical protein
MDTCSTDEFRVCKKCEQKLPNTAEYFYHAKQKTKDGIYTPSLRSKCKSCYIGPKKEKVVRTHKVCTSCHVEFLNNNDYFRWITDTLGCRYLTSCCRKCESTKNAQYSLIRDHKVRSKELGLSIEEYSTGRYKGWAAHKGKFPSSTYEEYLEYRKTTRQRADVNRKKQRDVLTDNYVKSLITKRTKMGTEVLYDLSALIETYKLNLLIKRKVHGKHNTA